LKGGDYAEDCPKKVSSQPFPRHSLYFLGEEREGVRKNTKLLVAGRDVSVPELRVEDAPEFRPVGVEGLGDSFGWANLFYHPCLSGPTRFFITFGGGLRSGGK
jgi:hypothetical protein